MITAVFAPNFDSWRAEARRLLNADVPPGEILWPGENSTLSLFGAADIGPQPLATKKPAGVFSVPKEYLKLAEVVVCARDDDRWSLLYRILFRLKHGEPKLLTDVVDPDVSRANHVYKSITHDIHKMHAFVRFKRIDTDGVELYVAWHKPEHFITELAAPFFERRFGDKRWSIFTPDRSAHWDGTALTYGDGMTQHDFQHRDQFDEVWKTYYKSIFNPARLKLKAMRAEMSPKYWSSMPETALIPDLIRDAPARLQEMAKNVNVSAEPPPGASLSELKVAAAACTACPLFKSATQVVFGEGPAHAAVMIVGEQPGDQEDLRGRAFVGPAGEILNQALAAAGLPRESLYLTNAVKHFKWTRAGKRRLHQKPNGGEMHACRPWLEAEIARVKPRVIVALGATAGTSVLGRLPKITTERGQINRDSALAKAVVLTWHPSAILRTQTDPEKKERFDQLVADLKLAASALTPSEE